MEISTDIIIAGAEGVCIVALLVINIILHRKRKQIKIQIENDMAISREDELNQALSNKQRG